MHKMDEMLESELEELDLSKLLDKPVLNYSKWLKREPEVSDNEGSDFVFSDNEREPEVPDNEGEQRLWVDYIATLLASMTNYRCEACFIVPEQLRKSKIEAYMPKVVSIGPIYKGTRMNLQYMEGIKWRCMMHLLHRTKDAVESLKKCSKAMLALDEVVRICYKVDALKFDRENLAKIMLLDGCFLLELLISGNEGLDIEVNCRLHRPSPAVKVIEKKQVLSDLILIENQIPLFVLDILSKLLFRETFVLKDGVLESLFGYIQVPDFGSVSDFIGVFHSSFTEKEGGKCEANKDLSIPMASQRVAEISYKELKLKRCATRLEAAGITILAETNLVATPSGNGFDMNIRFSKVALEIPELHITKTLEDKWRNVIAWEVNRTAIESLSEDEPVTECRFIWYALFFQSLICCVHDIQLLRDRAVIVVHEAEKRKKKAMSNEDLLTFFRNLTDGLPDELNYRDSRFRKLFNDLNSHPSGGDYTFTIIWHVIRCFLTDCWYFCKDSIASLISHHIPTGWKLIAVFAAAAGLALTAAQTTFSAGGK